MSDRGLATFVIPGRRSAISLAVAFTTAVVTLALFTPRFTYWSGLGYNELAPIPEYGRARWALRQIDDLHIPINDPYHTVIAWRLLFPAVWHYAHLPKWLFLVTPGVGCLAALWLVAWLSYGQYGDWVKTWLTTAIFAALPWFFVSTGWLTYFDSWLVFGLIVAALIPSRIALAGTCLLTPWIDERFVLGLPVIFATRLVWLHKLEDRDRRAVAWDLVVLVAASLPYPAIRAVASIWGDPDSAKYVERHLFRVRSVGWDEYLFGLWSGYRAAWILIGAAIALAARRIGRLAASGVALVVAATAIGGLMIAADMSRTLTVLCPLVLVGAWLWDAWRKTTSTVLLGAVLLANLVLPAPHVMWGMKIPIRRLPSEIANWRNPPPSIVAARLVHEGNAALDHREFAAARDIFTSAIETDKTMWAAYQQRAIAYATLREIDLASRDLETVLLAQPTNPDAFFIRAALRGEQGDAAGALADMKQALQNAPEDWPRGVAARALVKKLSAGASP